MTGKQLIQYTVLEHADGAHTCAHCGAKLRAGERAISVWNPTGVSWHEHAKCERRSTDGATLGARLMQDIRDGKPVTNPAPDRKVQGT